MMDEPLVLLICFQLDCVTFSSANLWFRVCGSLANRLDSSDDFEIAIDFRFGCLAAAASPPLASILLLCFV